MRPKERPKRKTFAELFPQLFLFPLVLVTVGVLVYLFFVASAEDSRTVEELISDIESGGPHARRQDLYALAQKVRAKNSQDGVPEYFPEPVTRKLLALLEKTEGDPQLKKWLVLAVGRAGSPDLTVPVMAEIALGEAVGPEARAFAVQSLGLSRSPKAVAALEKVIAASTQPEDWELRWNALAALANIGDPGSAPILRRFLSDPRHEVSWSVACWLANFFGDSTGREILWNLVSWDFLDRQVGDGQRELLHAEKELYMAMGLEGLYKLYPDEQDMVKFLREKTKDSRSPKVQNAAFEILERQKSRARQEVKASR